MLEVINRLCHGLVAVPILAALRTRGISRALQEEAPCTTQVVALRLGANEGHLQAAFQLLEALECVTRGPAGEYTPGNRAQLVDRIPADVSDLLNLDFEGYLEGNLEAHLVAPWLDRSIARWNVADDMLADLLDGPLVVPLLLALRRRCATGLAGRVDVDWSTLPLSVRGELEEWFRLKGWAEGPSNAVRLTMVGQFLLDRSMIMAAAAAYRPMLARVDELLFGAAAAVFDRDDNGNEQHVDRTLNVEGSGFQHQKFFADLDQIAVAIFGSDDLASQPRYIADMGCGDGSLLLRLYRTIQERTARGRALDDYPLTLIGADFNEEALAAADQVLNSVPHVLLRGDVAQPERFVDDLRRVGVDDPDQVLHVRSFLDHNRPWSPPRDAARAETRARLASRSVQVDAVGRLISPAWTLENLVEHLSRWATVVGHHGLVLVEVHSGRPDLNGRYSGESESLHFDAYHALSSQYLVEPELFLTCAAEAGLFPRSGYSLSYPRTLPFTRITLDWFERRPYRIRHAGTPDLPQLLALDAACWPASLRTAPAELARRTREQPNGQLVLEQDGRITGALFSQRIDTVNALESIRHHALPDLAVANGPVIQLLGLNVDPRAGDQGLGDQLLEFGLRYFALTAGVTGVVGVTRCRDYRPESGEPFSAYVARLDERGLPVDSVLRFHVAHGASVRKVLPGFWPDDEANNGHGILIEYEPQTIRRLAAERIEGTSPARSDADLAAAPAGVRVEQSIREVLGGSRQHAYSPHRALRDIGLDSLDLMELRVLLSRRFGVEVEPTFLFQYATAAAVTDYFDSGGPASDARPAATPSRAAIREDSEATASAVATLRQTLAPVAGRPWPSSGWLAGSPVASTLRSVSGNCCGQVETPSPKCLRRDGTSINSIVRMATRPAPSVRVTAAFWMASTNSTPSCSRFRRVKPTRSIHSNGCYWKFHAMRWRTLD